MTPGKYILLVHDRQSRVSTTTEYDGKDAAFAALAARETDKAPDEEVVLFVAENVDVLKRTHPRYFGLPATIELQETFSVVLP